VGAPGNYWVYDDPFLTSGASCTDVAPAGKNGKSCAAEYYGILTFNTDFDTKRWLFSAGINATRLDKNGATLGVWNVADGAKSWTFANMRHFAAMKGGRFTFTFPGYSVPKWIMFDVTNAYRPDDWVILGIPFDGTLEAEGYVTQSAVRAGIQKTRAGAKGEVPYTKWFTSLATYADMEKSTVPAIWQDKANNVVWMKYVPVGNQMKRPDESYITPGSDADLYRTNQVSIFQKGNTTPPAPF
jgi:hypothetical protein